MSGNIHGTRQDKVSPDLNLVQPETKGSETKPLPKTVQKQQPSEFPRVSSSPTLHGSSPLESRTVQTETAPPPRTALPTDTRLNSTDFRTDGRFDQLETTGVEKMKTWAEDAVHVQFPPPLTLKTALRRIGDFFKKRCRGYGGYLFTGSTKLAGQVGLKSKRRFNFMSGSLECRLYQYYLY